MSEVLFGQSYYLRFDPKLWEAMQPYPPPRHALRGQLHPGARL
ncbi:MAG: hypothetical protein M5R40_17495 [Anaerolineae bacterium]|nr:hypothetical protein [Anaerolineae bacterium]